MQTERPLLTIGIPTYNSAHFLSDSVGSVMRQGLSDFEIVIVDNASLDNTEEVVNSMGNPRIRYFRNTTNLGSRENHNRCLSEGRGRYFKFLGADDVLLEGVLTKQLSVLEDRQDVTLVTCNLSLTNSKLDRDRTLCCFPGSCLGSDIINLCLSGLNNYIGGPSNFMFRLADAAGLSMNDSYRYVSDLRFGLQLLQRGNYVNIDDIGYLYRRHASSDTETNCPASIRMHEYLRLVEEFGWWNPFNCLQSLRRGGGEGRQTALHKWKIACQPNNILRGAVGFTQVLNMWRLSRQAR